MSFENIDDVFPISSVQAGMLYHCLEADTQRAYVSHITFTLQGALDIEAWQLAWKNTCDRHDALRASFVWDGLDEPLQMINTSADLKWSISDLRNIEEHEQNKQIDASLDGLNRKGIDINSSPLMHFTMHRVAEKKWRVIWSIHHLLADGWSTPLILQSVLAFYSGQQDLPPGPGYANYIAWENKRDNSKALEWWQTHLSEAVSTPLQILPPKVVDTKPCIPHVIMDFTSGETTKLQEFLSNSGLTLATLVHAAWALTVSAYSGSVQPLFGTAVSGRHPEMPHSEDTVGLFLKTLPLLVNVDDSLSRIEFLQRLQLLLVACNSHDAIPLTKLNQLIDSRGASLAFESIVVIEGHANDIELCDTEGSITINSIDYSTHSNYPLALLAFPGEQIKFKLVYDEAFIDERGGERLVHHFGKFLNGLIKTENLTVGDCFGVVQFQADPSPEIVQPVYPLLHEWMCGAAQRTPDSAAIVCGDESITYAELDKQSNQVASLILDRKLPANTGIGLYIPRSLDQVIGLIGVLKAGHYYVPFDTEAPCTRTSMLISLADLEFVLGSGGASVPGEPDIVMLDIDQRHEFPATAVSAKDPDAIAYVMFTSGSTGQPKGVPVTHRNLAYSTGARLQYYGESACKYLLLSSISFDSSVAGIYGCLCAGGTLVMPRPSEEKELTVLADLISTHNITHTLCLPSLYSLLLENTDPSLLSSLRTVIVAGEVCKAHVVNRHFALMPETDIYNEYGPTEATVWSTVHRIDRADASDVPIGTAIPGTRVNLVDRNDRICPAGVIGEIEIVGPGVTDGYITGLSKPPINSESATHISAYRTGDLAVRTDSGNLLYLGRKDRQLNVRGYRIEPAEIEAALLEIEEITEAVVVAKHRPARSVTAEEIIQTLKNLPAEVTSELLANAEAIPRKSVTSVDSKS